MRTQGHMNRIDISRLLVQPQVAYGDLGCRDFNRGPRNIDVLLYIANIEDRYILRLRPGNVRCPDDSVAFAKRLTSIVTVLIYVQNLRVSEDLNGESDRLMEYRRRTSTANGKSTIATSGCIAHHASAGWTGRRRAPHEYRCGPEEACRRQASYSDALCPARPSSGRTDS